MENINMGLLTSKGICALVLHLAMQKNLMQGNDMMKYALNHDKRFLNPANAFTLGLVRTLSTASVQTISLIVIFTS